MQQTCGYFQVWMVESDTALNKAATEIHLNMDRALYMGCQKSTRNFVGSIIALLLVVKSPYFFF